MSQFTDIRLVRLVKQMNEQIDALADCVNQAAEMFIAGELQARQAKRISEECYSRYRIIYNRYMRISDICENYYVLDTLVISKFSTAIIFFRD